MPISRLVAAQTAVSGPMKLMRIAFCVQNEGTITLSVAISGTRIELG